MSTDALIQKLLAHKFPGHLTDNEARMHNGAMDDDVLIVREWAAGTAGDASADRN